MGIAKASDLCPSEEYIAAKNSIRKKIKDLWEGLVPGDLSILLQAHRQQLAQFFATQLSPTKEVLILGLYAPLQDEPQLHPEDWKNLIFESAYPGEEEGKPIFRRATLEELKPTSIGGKNFYSPPEDAPIAKPDILLIPGVAFTQEGLRLGRGLSYYDRYLAQTKALKIGVCFEYQILEELPTDEWDQSVEIIITEKEIRTIKQGLLSPEDRGPMLRR